MAGIAFDRSLGIGFGIAAFMGAVCLLVVAIWPGSHPRQRDLGPNTILHTISHDYERFPPDTTAERGDGWPENRVVESTARYGSDACIADLEIVTTSPSGDLLERTDFQGTTVTTEQQGAPPQGSESGTDIGNSCVIAPGVIKSKLEDLAQSLGTTLETTDAGEYLIAYPIDTSAAAVSGSDLDIASVEIEVHFDATSLRRRDMATIATTTAGEKVVLNRSTVVSQEVYPAD